MAVYENNAAEKILFPICNKDEMATKFGFDGTVDDANLFLEGYPIKFRSHLAWNERSQGSSGRFAWTSRFCLSLLRERLH
mmetsp:Transcript_40880/g.79991  ORF Transcript_40880/g.79991 Transcript_40880/m.79991 type:complete len:80 (-) Transcript_40880:400-639(-)